MGVENQFLQIRNRNGVDEAGKGGRAYINGQSACSTRENKREKRKALILATTEREWGIGGKEKRQLKPTAKIKT